MITSFQCYANDKESKLVYYNSLIPKDVELRERILTGVYCDDVSTIQKCAEAGQMVFADGKNYQVMHNGIKILPDSYYGKWMTLLIQFLQGHHEPQEERVFFEVLKSIPPGATMLELGSYWGYYSLWFKKEIPDAKTYLIEPDDKNLQIGKEHFLCNHYEGDFTHAMIGSSSIEEAPFTNWDYEISNIKQVCIDDFVEEKQIPFIHILHSDIQGAEVDMLKGCQKLIREKRVGYFFVSTHRGTHEPCLRAFENSEYEILLSFTREESFSADGLIIAKSPDYNGHTT
ncbi:MAG: FkbM family methyltransferase, partial [Silvanigrellaceae bacterium]|nr:FkbM family methyltransferase [Silvanigrellaceae bacterium]